MTVTGESDLSITKTDGQTLTVPGAVVTYTLVVRNAGPSAVTGARVDDPVPATLLGADVDLHGLARVALSGRRRRSDSCAGGSPRGGHRDLHAQRDGRPRRRKEGPL